MTDATCYTRLVSVGTLLRERETVRLSGSFPTEWPGFHPRTPWMGKTLLVDRNDVCLQVVRPRWATTGHLSVALDVSLVEAEAALGHGF